MRTLKFIVDKQIIKQDPSCDFTGLVPGSDKYLKAEFSFSKEWESMVKVVGFYSNLGKEYLPQALNDGKSCVIPAIALENRVFKLKVFGRKGDTTLRTNKIAVKQDGDKS